MSATAPRDDRPEPGPGVFQDGAIRQLQPMIGAPLLESFLSDIAPILGLFAPRATRVEIAVTITRSDERLERVVTIECGSAAQGVGE